MANLRCPAAHDQVVLAFNDSSKSFATLESEGTIRLRQGSFQTSILIGQPYGSVWELVGGSISRVEDGVLDAHMNKGNDMDDDDGTDNRALVDTNSAQALGPEEIAAMKRDGATGGVIVRSLIENSTTFAAKTAFSQEKYVRRKTAKYVRRFRLTRSTAFLACEMLHERDPHKIGWLRPDSLGQLLQAGNVHAGGCLFVADGVGGILAGAVAEQMAVEGGEHTVSPTGRRIHGSVVLAMPDSASQPNLTHADRLEVGACLRASMINISYGALSRYPALQGSVMQEPETEKANVAEHALPSGAGAGSKRKRRGASSEAKKVPAIDDVLLKGLDSILIAIPEDPTLLLLAACRLAKPSCSFAVFSLDLQILAGLCRRLRHLGVAAAMQLSETWTREYQVLADRTHPTMGMDGMSGYILAGTVLDHAWQLPFSTSSSLAHSGAEHALERKGDGVASTSGSEHDSRMMAFACSLAEQCISVQTAYNVGAVLVAPDGSSVISTGFSRELPGNTHAEEVCLMKAAAQSCTAVGGTMYTTMEPCSKRLSGKRPCADILIEAGIARVVQAVPEPPNFVDCTSVQILRSAGVRVELIPDTDLQRRSSACNAHITAASGPS